MRRHVTLTSLVIVGALVFAAAGCFPFPFGGGGGSNGGPYDGTWMVMESPAGAKWCITVQENEIVDHDDGCDGSSELVIDTSSGPGVGAEVKWIVTVRFPNQGNLDISYNYDVREQQDGSLAGDVTRIPSMGGMVGAPDVVPIIMTQN